MLPIKKVYVDSKYKTEDSISDSDFKFELGQSITLPDDAKFFISDCCIPHSWRTVEYWNNKLYTELEWERPTVKLYGKQYLVPRKTVFLANDNQKLYGYLRKKVEKCCLTTFVSECMYPCEKH